MSLAPNQTAAHHQARVSPHPVRKYVDKVASKDREEYPEWDLTAPLPKLPVPTLADTLQRYLRCLEPVTSDESYEQTKQIVEKFGQDGGEGEKLQELLKEYAENTDCWAYQFWLDDMYLKNPAALPINSNVGMVFPRQHFADRGDQLRFAARLISGILDYKLIIDSHSLPIDRARLREKGQPLCMEQYYRLFSSYRVPGEHKDTLMSSQPNGVMQDPEHVIVLCKNQIFILDVVVNHSRLSDDNIYTQMKKIVDMAEGSEDDESSGIGILTADERPVWSEARARLLEASPVNRESLDLIERCIFVLCLDDAIPLSFNHARSLGQETRMGVRDDTSLATQMLHGFGSKVNSRNRWFDKTMQFIVGEDGACGLNYEHSPAEGIAVVQLIEHLLKYMREVERKKLPRLQTIREMPPPRKLIWNLTTETRNDISHACDAMDSLIASLDLYILNFRNYGKDFPKSQNMSPDVYIQLALQLTYYKIYGHLVPTYESATIRRFRYGRVDNIRACTSECLEWCRAMCGHIEATEEEKMKLFRQAIKRQTDVLTEALLGFGIDNHLLGLRRIAEEHSLPTSNMFTDKSYTMSNHFTLSTSQVPTTMDAFMLYGPVVPDGYGACYNPHPGYMRVAVTSFLSCGETRSDHFAATLESNFMYMKDLCQNNAITKCNAVVA